VTGPQVDVGHEVAGVGLGPKLVSLDGPLKLPSDQAVVQTGDGELLPLAHPVAQLVRLLEVFAAQSGLSEIGIGPSQDNVGQGKIGIELDSTLEGRNGCGVAFCAECL